MKLSLIGSYMISLGSLLLLLGVFGVVNDSIGLFGLCICVIGNVFCWVIPRFQGELKTPTCKEPK